MTTNRPFGDCKNAALHQTTKVQPFGALVAINAASHLIEYCSSNTGDLLDRKPAELLGHTASGWLSKSWSAVASLASLEGRIQVAPFAVPTRCPMVVAGHRRGSHLLLEFEPAHSGTADFWGHAKRSEFLEPLAAVRTVQQCYEFVVHGCLIRRIRPRDAVSIPEGLARRGSSRAVPRWCQRISRPALPGL